MGQGFIGATYLPAGLKHLNKPQGPAWTEPAKFFGAVGGECQIQVVGPFGANCPTRRIHMTDGGCPDLMVPIRKVPELKALAERSCLNRWAATGVIPGCRKIGRTWVIRQSDLKAFLAGEKGPK